MDTILVVDDDQAIQAFYADELGEEGYQVITTGDGSRLMGLIEKTRPDVIVLDSNLGGYENMDLIKQIRSTDDDLPVILSTIYPAHRYDLESIAVDHAVVKRSDLTELKLKIKMAIDDGRGARRKNNEKALRKNTGC